MDSESSRVMSNKYINYGQTQRYQKNLKTPAFNFTWYAFKNVALVLFPALLLIPVMVPRRYPSEQWILILVGLAFWWLGYAFSEYTVNKSNSRRGLSSIWPLVAAWVFLLTAVGMFTGAMLSGTIPCSGS